MPGHKHSQNIVCRFIQMENKWYMKQGIYLAIVI